MLPESRVSLTPHDVWHTLGAERGDELEQTERAFAAHFGFPQALLFPQGRSAIYTLLTILGGAQSPVILPAYTCAVVAHAVSAGGGALHFADSAADHFLPGAAEWERALDPEAVLAIPTPMYGYPLTASCIPAIRHGAPKAFVLLDEAQSFSGTQMGDADGALLSLGLGKTLSALSGGILLLRDSGLADRVRVARDQRWTAGGRIQVMRMAMMALAAWAILREPGFSIARAIGSVVPSLSYARIAQHDPQDVPVPAGSTVKPSAFQARLGLEQLVKLGRILGERRQIGTLYQTKLTARGFRTFAHDGMPTWVRYPLPVSDRAVVAKALEHAGIQIGYFLRYSSAALPLKDIRSGLCPNAALWGRSMINLPVWSGLSDTCIAHVVDTLSWVRDRLPAAVAWPS